MVLSTTVSPYLRRLFLTNDSNSLSVTARSLLEKPFVSNTFIFRNFHLLTGTSSSMSTRRSFQLSFETPVLISTAALGLNSLMSLAVSMKPCLPRMFPLLSYLPILRRVS